MTPEMFRNLALQLPGASEGAHHGHADFRVGGKIFATLGYPSVEFATICLRRRRKHRLCRPSRLVRARPGWLGGKEARMCG